LILKISERLIHIPKAVATSGLLFCRKASPERKGKRSREELPNRGAAEDEWRTVGSEAIVA
jgi:hypothetical protein